MERSGESGEKWRKVDCGCKLGDSLNGSGSGQMSQTHMAHDLFGVKLVKHGPFTSFTPNKSKKSKVRRFHEN